MFQLAARVYQQHQNKLRQESATARRVTLEQRQAWADAIRAPIRNHPKAWACASSPHRRKALTGNRRSAKTTTVGSETLARLIENDHHICWVFVDKLAEFTRNWVARGYDPHLDPATAKQTGLLQQLHLHAIPHTTTRNDPDRYTGVQFPWGSKLVIYPAEHANQVASARGGAFHDLWLDEAQKMPQILAILDDVGTPAAKDFQGTMWMTGTPGTEVGTFFHRVVAGDNGDWAVWDITSADNPFFGDTWRERYERSIMSSLRATRHTNHLTGQDLENLAGLEEDTFSAEHLESLAWVRRLNPSIRREALRLWVSPGAEMIYPQDHIPPEIRYWAEFAPTITVRALGIDVTPEEVQAQTDGWVERFAQLPKVERSGRSYARHWNAVLCQDLGRSPDPMAITLQVWADHDALYEFDSAKILGLREDQMIDILAEWIKAAKRLANVTLWGVVVDDDGGATPSMVDAWRHKLAPLLPAVGILDAYKPKRDMQIALLNTERAAGRVRILRNGPIDIEEQHLRKTPWDPERPTKKRDQDKHREVVLAVADVTGRKASLRCTPGNDALDARRYGWWRCTRLLGTMDDPKAKPPRMSEGEWIEQQIERQARGHR